MTNTNNSKEQDITLEEECKKKLEELDTLVVTHDPIVVVEILKSTHSSSFDEKSPSQIRSLASEILTLLFRLQSFQIPATLPNDPKRTLFLEKVRINAPVDGSDYQDCGSDSSHFMFELKNVSKESPTSETEDTDTSFELAIRSDIPHEHYLMVKNFGKLIGKYRSIQVAEASKTYLYKTNALPNNKETHGANEPVQTKTDVNQVEPL